ncbi:MAG: hypothetical protein M3119_02405 [Verrucomicrobiota bacterium]|nr:hypothetical protein [Verrucomicrobiota bacterium]MDQ6938988.1 hypothetical protein [Verrucomicrobiota bacterium]
MKKSIFLAVCAAFVFNFARGTTVVPPSFDELVGQAEVIFQGTVSDVKSQWTGEGAERHIVTYVTLQIEEAIKGDPGATYTMRMLGGTVDGTTMEVSDVPKFKVGDRDILFVEHNGTQFVPLVGIMHGRFHVQTDAARGADVVLKNNGDAVKDLAQLGKEDFLKESHATSAGQDRAAGSLDATSFKSAIRAKLGALTK